MATYPGTINVGNSVLGYDPNDLNDPKNPASPLYKPPTQTDGQGITTTGTNYQNTGVQNSNQAPAAGTTNLRTDLKPGETVQLTQGGLLQQAGQAASAGYQSPTLAAASQQTQNLMNGPAFDANAYQQSILDRDARLRDQALQQYGQQTADLAGSGIRNRELLNFALNSAQERRDLESDTAVKAQELARKQAMENIAQGITTAGAEQGAFQTGVSNLIGVAGAMEGGEQRTFTQAENALDRASKLEVLKSDQDFQTGLATLQGNIQKGLLITGKDYDATLERLRQAGAEALQKGDIAGQTEIATLMNEFQTAQNEAQRNFTRAERIATQSWSSEERISTQDFTAAQAAIDRNLEEAMADKNLAMQDKWNTAKDELALTMQLQGFGHDEKMAQLDNQYATAMAEGNLDRAKVLASYSAKIDLDKMAAQNDYDVVLQNNQAKIEEAKAQGDFIRASALQVAQQVFTATESAKDRYLEKLGIDYEMLADAAENGQISPDAIVQNLQQAFKDSGITIEAPDPAQIELEIQHQYDSTKFSWSLSQKATNPAYFTGDTLNTTGETAFAEYYNETLFKGTAPADTAKIIIDSNDATGHHFTGADDPVYKALATKLPDHQSVSAADLNTFNASVLSGKQPIRNIGGKVLQFTYAPNPTGSGNVDYSKPAVYKATDLATGKTVYVSYAPAASSTLGMRVATVTNTVLSDADFKMGNTIPA